MGAPTTSHVPPTYQLRTPAHQDKFRIGSMKQKTQQPPPCRHARTNHALSVICHRTTNPSALALETAERADISQGKCDSAFATPTCSPARGFGCVVAAQHFKLTFPHPYGCKGASSTCRCQHTLLAGVDHSSYQNAQMMAVWAWIPWLLIKAVLGSILVSVSEHTYTNRHGPVSH